MCSQPMQAVPGAAFDGRVAMKVKRCMGIAPPKDSGLCNSAVSPQTSKGELPSVYSCLPGWDMLSAC